MLTSEECPSFIKVFSKICTHRTAFIIICLLSVGLLSRASRQQPDSIGGGGGKPPRGYCTHISRAISPNSRCHDHLVGSKLNSYHNSGGTTRNNNDAATQSQGRQQDVSRDRTLVGGGEAATEVEGSARRLAQQAQEEEELVYVRLETAGDNIDNLNTRAINERVVMGVLGQLLDPTDNHPAAKESSSQFLPGEDPQWAASIADIRAQILGSSQESTKAAATVAHPPLSAAQRCRLSIERFLCRMAYPSCHFRRSDVSALVRPPCREDCLLLRDVLCSNLNWPKFSVVLTHAFNITLMSTVNALDLENQGAFIAAPARQRQQQHPAAAVNGGGGTNTAWDGHNLNSSIHFYWPHEHSIQRCESLPPLRPIAEHNNKHPHHQPASANRHETARGARFGRISNSKPASLRWPVCSNAGLTRASASPSTPPSASHSVDKATATAATFKQTSSLDVAECLESDDGLTYKGYMNRTRSGLTCQPWTSQEPHQHTSSELLFDNMKEAHTFCRNPGGIELKPWCYTRNENVRWEYCEIARC